MSTITVVRGADEHWWESRWNCVVEYKGNKYVICVMENNKWSEQDIYYYDDCVKYNIGEAVDDDDINENVLVKLSDAWGLSQTEFTEGSVYDDEDEDSSYEPPDFVIPNFPN